MLKTCFICCFIFYVETPHSYLRSRNLINTDKYKKNLVWICRDKDIVRRHLGRYIMKLCYANL